MARRFPESSLQAVIICKGIAGLNWRSKLVPIKVLDAAGLGFISWLIQGLDWAREHGIPILNASLGVIAGVPADSLGALNEACLNTRLTGQLLVAASGNINTVNGADQIQPIYPAAFHQRVAAVGAILPDGARWRDIRISPTLCSSPGANCFASNFGNWLDFEAAGGRFIVTTRGGSEGDYYRLDNCTPGSLENTGFSGTSAAAPVVTGVASLLRSFRPDLSGEDLEQVMKLTALNLPSPPYDVEDGWGIVRASHALNFVAPPKVVAHWSVGPGLSFPIGQFTVADSSPAPITVRFLSVPGMPTSDYTASCTRYTLHAIGNFMFPFSVTPNLWTTSAGTVGARDTTVYDFSYEVPFGRVLSVSTTTATIETFAYRVAGVGWFPAPPDQVRAALTAVGPTPTAGVPEASSLRADISVFPNPAVRAVVFRITVPTRMYVRARVLDLAGRTVVDLSSGDLELGVHDLGWGGQDARGRKCAPGLYFLSADLSGTRRMARFFWLGPGR